MTKEEAKHLSEVLKAYSEGKEIEMKSGNDWIAICKEPWFTGNPMSYRVKPEPKYRPYANAEEFLKAQKEHGPMILRWKNDFRFPTQVKNTGIWVTNFQCNVKYEWLTYEKISRDNITWQDGAPCGIIEE